MSRISDLFAAGHGPVLIGFTVAGDPDFKTSVGIARTLAEAGVGILELGVPFTDPVADGQVIQRAHERALAAGATTDRLFEEVREIRKHSEVPIVLLVYYNIIYQRGVEAFCRSSRDAGIDGILVVDLPPEESAEMQQNTGKYGIDQIFIITPGTSDERIRLIAGTASGFLYLTTLLGVTGAREELSKEAGSLVGRVRKSTHLPLCVGFGIAHPEHAGAIASAGADGVIVGSAIVGRIEAHNNDITAMNENIRNYIKTLRDAIGN